MVHTFEIDGKYYLFDVESSALHVCDALTSEVIKKMQNLPYCAKKAIFSHRERRLRRQKANILRLFASTFATIAICAARIASLRKALTKARAR